MFCAFSDPEIVQDNIASELAQSRLTGRPNAPHDAAVLHDWRKRILKRGFCVLEDGGKGGSAAVSVPILNAEGQVAFALSVFAHVGRLNLDPDGPFIEMVVSKARSLSEQLGYR